MQFGILIQLPASDYLQHINLGSVCWHFKMYVSAFIVPQQYEIKRAF